MKKKNKGGALGRDILSPLFLPCDSLTYISGDTWIKKEE